MNLNNQNVSSLSDLQLDTTSSSNSQPSTLDNSTNISIPSVPPKKKRGRPRKIKMDLNIPSIGGPSDLQLNTTTSSPSASSQPSTSDNSTDISIPTVVPPKKKRGKPRKRKMDFDANVQLIIDDTKKSKDTDEDKDSTATEVKSLQQDDTCPICFDQPLHPFRLPCSHLYCFLCAKGLAESNSLGDSPKCSMCRQSFSRDIFKNQRITEISNSNDLNSFSWFYEGRNGWWKFDSRSSNDIEEAFTNNLPKITLLICGNLYDIDLTALIQYRQDRTGKIRRIKRDLTSAYAKGTAGLAQND